MTFSVFGLTGYWYGLIAGLGALVYLWAAGTLGFYRRLPPGTVRLYGLVGIPLALVLARLGFCVVNAGYFTQSISQPLKMLYFWDGGYSLLGVLCALVLAAFLVSRLYGVRFGTLLDVVAAPLGLLLFGFRLAEGFTNGQLGVGKQVDAGAFTRLFPWLFVQDQMGTLTLYRLAVYRYEAAAAIILLLLSLFLFFGRRQLRKARQGDVAMIVFSLFGAMQVILESLRDDGHMIVGFIRIQQVGYAFMPVLALVVLGARYAHIRQKRKTAVAAWLLLPVAAIVAYMMIEPLNHVLDLTGHRGIGFIVLGLIAVYCAFFLRGKRTDYYLVFRWLLAVGAVAGCVWVEFSVDGSTHMARDYLIMAGCCALLFASPYGLWRRLEKNVYREESIRVQI